MKNYKLVFVAILLSVVLVLAGCSSSAPASESGAASAAEAPAASGESAAIPDTAPEALAPEGEDYAAGDYDDGDYAMEAEDSIMMPPQGGDNAPSTIEPRAGLLTAGEWNDNLEYDYLLGLMQGHTDWESFSRYWKIALSRRSVVRVTDGGSPVNNAQVVLANEDREPIWISETDNTGTAYLFNGIARENSRVEPRYILVTAAGNLYEQDYDGTGEYTFPVDAPSSEEKSLDLMLVVDTTGSMGDELDFLKVELESVINQVKEDNANIPVRLSVNVYRDIGDDYVVRSNPFDTNIAKSVAFLQKQRAAGGGDYEEAVELALADAIYDHEWNLEATARIILLVLDAPPHNTQENRRIMKELMEDASAQGIRIIPVASSGVDKNTEFLMRSLSTTTGGSYVFLTDHSGVGESHLEPTIGQYQVELLDNLLVRLINRYLA